MPGGSVIELAREAAAAARNERRARGAAPLPARRYRGVQSRGSRYVAVVWNPAIKRPMWLGSYATPEEAAYAYDAAARHLLGRWAGPNFPAPAAPTAAAGAPENLARAQEPAARQQQQQPAPRAQVPFPHWAAPAPAGAAAQPQRAVFTYRRAGTPSSPAAAIYAAAYGAPFFEVTLLPSAYAAPELNRPASSAGPVGGASLSPSAAAPERLIEPDQAVVGDNFTDDGGASSSSATRAFFW